MDAALMSCVSMSILERLDLISVVQVSIAEEDKSS